MKKILLIWLLLGSLAGYSQTQDFNLLFNKAEEKYAEEEYISAFVYYDKAMEKAVRRTQQDSAYNKKEECRKLILQQQEDLHEALFDADSLLNVANSIIGAFYFYDGILALAYKDNKYGFIDKTGEAIIPYLYDEARPFDTYGLARVKRNRQDYLINKTHTEYLLSDGFGNLRKNTQAIDLRNKQLTDFPEMVIQSPRLNILLLSKNEIRRLPPTIDTLSNLKYLILSGNELKSLPSATGNLKNLLVLDVSDNQIRTLPPDIGNANSLIELNVRGNLLTSLPESLGSLKNLVSLQIGNNQLDTLPASLKNLTRLKSFHADDNQLNRFPPVVFS